LNDTNQRRDRENSKLKEELGDLQQAKQRIDEENLNLRRELRNLKVLSNINKRDIKTLNSTDEAFSKYNDDLRLLLQMLNESVQRHDAQLQDISSQLSPGKDTPFYYNMNVLCGISIFLQHVKLKIFQDILLFSLQILHKKFIDACCSTNDQSTFA
jgi:hypothetical protein